MKTLNQYKDILYTDFEIKVDGEKVMVSDFIEDNTAEGVWAIEDDFIKGILELNPGESTFIPSHAGWTRVERPHLTLDQELERLEFAAMDRYDRSKGH